MTDSVFLSDNMTYNSSVRQDSSLLLPMLELQKLLEITPNVPAISLEYENIRDLTLCIKKLQKFKYLRSLSLHGNHIRVLPLMTGLQLVTLDLTNNPIQIDNYLLDSLFSMPSLQNLLIDANEAEVERLLENLPNLKTLNKKKVVREKIVDKKNDLSERMKNSLKQERDKVKDISRNILQKFEFYDSEALNAFDSNFNQIFEQYSNFTQNVRIDTAKQGVFLYSKNKLVDILQQKLANTLSQHKLEHIADAVEQIGVLRKQYFDGLLRIVLQVGYDQCCLEDDLGDQINTEMKNIKLRKERLYLKEIMRLKKKINQYRTYLNKLQEQNSKQLHSLYSLTRGDVSSVMKQNEQNLRVSTNPMEIFPSRLLNKQNQKPQKNRENLTPTKPTQKNQVQATPRKKQISKTGIKQPKQSSKGLLSFDQTIALMQEFITDKFALNDKAKKKKEAYDTAEEHLSNFFTAKYGVKKIAINWSLNFIRSLEVYARENSLCQAFLKILKHSVQESFYEEHLRFIENLKADFAEFKEETISQSEAENLFLRYFPTEDLDQFKIITKFGQLTPENIFKQLCKTHVKTHQKLLQQFCSLFKKYDLDQDGALTLEQSKQFVTQFFKPKIEKAIVTHGIIDKVTKKLDPSKKNKIIFSQLVDIIDKII